MCIYIRVHVHAYIHIYLDSQGTCYMHIQHIRVAPSITIFIYATSCIKGLTVYILPEKYIPTGFYYQPQANSAHTTQCREACMSPYAHVHAVCNNVHIHVSRMLYMLRIYRYVIQRIFCKQYISMHVHLFYQ